MTVFTQLDYCLVCCPWVQNTAARTSTWTRRGDHNSPVLKSFVLDMCLCKILILVFKSLCDLAPIYFGKLIIRYVPTRPLRWLRGNLPPITIQSRVSLQLQWPWTDNLKVDDNLSILWNTLPLTSYLKKCHTNKAVNKTIIKYNHYLYWWMQ